MHRGTVYLSISVTHSKRGRENRKENRGIRMTDELKPVPCGCGGEANVISGTYIPRSLVICRKFGIGTMTFDTEAGAIMAWNRAMGERTAKATKFDSGDLISREFQRIVVSYPSICTYPEYEGKPYFAIQFIENGKDEIIGFGTYNPEVLSQYLKEYFLPERTAKATRNPQAFFYHCECGYALCCEKNDMNYCPNCGARLEWE